MAAFDRMAWLAGRDGRAATRPSGPTLADALMDRDIAMVRIRARRDQGGRAYHDVSAFTGVFRRLWFHPTSPDLDKQAREQLAEWLFAAWPDVDWTRDHQLIVATGQVHAAPPAKDHGGIPEDDETFGILRPPVLLTTFPTVTIPESRAAA